jgi:hypothetical protein
MIMLKVRPDLEMRLNESLASGVDANEIVESALNLLAERESLRREIEIGWKQADAGQFVITSPEQVIRKARMA